MSPRNTTIRADKIEYGFWLMFDADGSVSLTRNEPRTGRGQIAMSCVSTLPRDLFRKPTLTATIVVDPGAPAAFNVNVQAVGDALKNALGLDIDLQVRTTEQDA